MAQGGRGCVRKDVRSVVVWLFQKWKQPDMMKEGRDPDDGADFLVQGTDNNK